MQLSDPPKHVRITEGCKENCRIPDFPEHICFGGRREMAQITTLCSGNRRFPDYCYVYVHFSPKLILFASKGKKKHQTQTNKL